MVAAADWAYGGRIGPSPKRRKLKTQTRPEGTEEHHEGGKVFRYGELFAGAGGLALGAFSAHVEKDGRDYRLVHTWANDLDTDACETYRKNLAVDDPASVANVGVQDFLETGLAYEPIDVLAFGFPCNDFSIVGETNGYLGEYGQLYEYGEAMLGRHQPEWFIAENVTGLRSADDGMAFRSILEDLSEAGVGYRLTPHLYKFEQYGVPQARHRIIVIGIRRDLDVEFKVPAPSHPNQDDWVTAKQAIERPRIKRDAPNHEFTQHPQRIVDRLKHIPPGENAWYEGLPEELQLNVKGARLSQIYRRLDPNRPSYTITGSGGGGTHGYHWSEPRALTNRERARLQTFPDDFVFEGGKESVRRQIGMAVPPLGARAIVEAVLKSFAGVEYESVPSNLSGLLKAGPRQLSLFLTSHQHQLEIDMNIPHLHRTVVLPLVKNNGEVHATSGLNWGQRPGRNPDEAYIPVPSEVHDKYKEFFPPRREPFVIETFDGNEFRCVIAQQNDKAIETVESNSLLGAYFRRLLGLKPGTRVETQHLHAYGRLDVTITRLTERRYWLEFGKPSTHDG